MTITPPHPPKEHTGVSYCIDVRNDPLDAYFVVEIKADDGLRYSVPESLAPKALRILGEAYPKPAVRFLADKHRVITEFLPYTPI